jgi:hypothetical protein
MMRTVAFPILAGILSGLPARDARAEGPSCSQMTIEADPSVEARWPRLSQRVRETFEAREDLDRCARVLLSSRDEMISVDVSLPDGRSAHRSVSEREDVIPALEALLIVPRGAPIREEMSSPFTTTTAAPSMLATATPLPAGSPALKVASLPAREAPGPMPAQPSSHLRIELSVLTGARIGDGQASVGVGAVSFLDLSGWLVGFAGRADRYEMLGGAHHAAALELALLGGRRLRLRTMALDLVGGPAVALGGTAIYETQTQAGDVRQSASNTVPRLLVEARLVFAALSTVHTFVAVDGDFGPANSPDASLLPNAPRLPTWTAGLALGATVGTP